MATSKTDRAWQHPLVPAHQLRIGDVARTPNGQEWELRDRPRALNGGTIIAARVVRPGDSRTATDMTWPAGEMVHVRRPTKPSTA